MTNKIEEKLESMVENSTTVFARAMEGEKISPDEYSKKEYEIMHQFGKTYSCNEKLNKIDLRSLDSKTQYLRGDFPSKDVVLCKDIESIVTNKVDKISQDYFLPLLHLIKEDALNTGSEYKYLEGLVEAGLNSAESYFNNNKIYSEQFMGSPKHVGFENLKEYEVRCEGYRIEEGLNVIYLIAESIGKEDYFVDRLNKMRENLPKDDSLKSKHVRDSMERIRKNYPLDIEKSEKLYSERREPAFPIKIEQKNLLKL